MRKKKELPRKRRRFVKKIIFLILLLFIVILIAGSISFYFFEAKMQKLYPTTAVTHHVQSNQPDKTYSELEEGLNKDQIEYTSISKGNDLYVVTLKTDGKVTFSSQKDIMTQIASLQYILSHLTMEGRQFSTLDLRFDQPVIVLDP